MAASEKAEDTRVRLGILGTSLMGRPDLREGLADNGLQIVVEETLSTFLTDIEHQSQVDVLLVDLEQADDDDLDILDALLEHSPVPMVFHEEPGRSGNAAWMRRLAAKISDAARAPVTPPPKAKPVVEQAPVQKAPARPARPTAPLKPIKGLKVWVLGASFGGPEALKRFLTNVSEVPKDVAFIIGQHIGDGFVEVLASQLNRATAFKVVPAASGMQLESGTIYVAPVRERLRIDAQGVLRLEKETEPRTYMPSIDAIMEEVAERFGTESGAIIFSGMGNDGTEGCQAIARAGGLIWAQEAGSCAIDSMPSCARATGLVRRNGAPEDLARAMVQHFKQGG